jgi:ACS family hexuronate transporter-like MFS transporter
MKNLKNEFLGNQEKPLRMRWMMITFAFMATVLNYLHRLSFNYLAADGYLRDLIPDDSFGYLGTAFFLAYMVSNGFSGFIIDKLGTRAGYSLCMAFWTTAGILHALARAPLHFGIVRFLLGIGEAGNWPAALKLTGEWFTPEERSTASGIFNSGAAAGAIIVPPLIAYLGTTIGWQYTFVVIGILGYLWVAAFWFTYYTPEHAKKEARARIIPPRILFKTPFVRWFVVLNFLIDPIWYFITFWIARYLAEVHQWDLAKIGWFAMFPFIIADLGNILGGYFTQFIIKRGVPVPKARKIATGIFGSLIALALILGPFLINGPGTALVVIGVAGFGYASYSANSLAFTPDVMPKSATASVYGIANIGSGLGGSFFQAITGLAVHKLSLRFSYALAYNTVFIGYGIMALIGLYIVLFRLGKLVPNKELHDYVLKEEV